MKEAIVFKGHQRVVECKLEGQIVSATIKGKILKEQSLVVGDKVLLKEDEFGWSVEEALPRKNEVFRIQVREQSKKTTAANIDYLVIVNSVSRPKYKRGFLDRYLVRAFQWGIEPLIVFNKMDEYKESKLDLKFEMERLKNLNVSFFEISAKESSRLGHYCENTLEELKQKIESSMTLFLGQSGVGKSTLISALTNQKVELKSQEVGKEGKGTHTTTWSEVIEFENFCLVDTPGIRSLSMEDLEEEEIIHYFPDLTPLSLQCRFKDCQHKEKSQGCSFYDDLNFRDEAEKKVIHSRLDSFHKIAEEASQKKHWEKDY